MDRAARRSGSKATTARARRSTSTSGAELTIGALEKMSKSKRNTVEPEEITANYGADTARWFMLSDSPPERDVEWTDAGVEGAHRFVQRVWRLMSRLAGEMPPPLQPRPATFSEDALDLRRHVHRTIDAVTQDLERLRFNRAERAASRADQRAHGAARAAAAHPISAGRCARAARRWS